MHFSADVATGIVDGMGEAATISRSAARAPALPVLALLGSGASSQVGAALGALAFPVVGPVGVVAVRQLVAAVVLAGIARPRLLRMSWGQWWPALLLGAVFAVMNLSLYAAIDRIGLGLATTLEFLGPLAVALAGSRSRTMSACAVGAGAGVVVLLAPSATTDWWGVGLGLGAACCWAAYILLNAVVGRRLRGLEGPAVASCVAALAYLPILITLVATGRFDPRAASLCLAVGLLSSVVPYATDVLTLRRIPRSLFGVVMSANPVLAAAAGVVVLGQHLHPWQWAAILVIVACDVVAMIASTPRPTRKDR